MDLVTFLELFAWPFTCLALVALCAPLVGAFLSVRGATFQGIVLPQVAAFGIALGFLAHPLVAGDSSEHAGHVHATGEPARGYLLLCAGLSVVAAQLFLATRRGGPCIGSSGADEDASASAESGVFVAASGGTVIASQLAPHGGLHVETLMSGETLATGALDAAMLGALLLVTGLTVRLGWRRLTVAGHDPEFAEVTGQRPVQANVLLAGLTTGVVLLGSLTVGVLAMFALLVLPALVSSRVATSMAGMLVIAPAIGITMATGGVLLAFGADLPVGASVVACGGLLWGMGALRAR